MSDVDEASHCVASVAKNKCHVVRSIAGLDQSHSAAVHGDVGIR